jgi:hypothetical protein
MRVPVLALTLMTLYSSEASKQRQAGLEDRVLADQAVRRDASSCFIDTTVFGTRQPTFSCAASRYVCLLK